MTKKYPKNKLPKRLRKSKPEQRTTGRIPERSIAGLGQIFPGFDDWYRSNYDEDGRIITPQVSMRYVVGQTGRIEVPRD